MIVSLCFCNITTKHDLSPSLSLSSAISCGGGLRRYFSDGGEKRCDSMCQLCRHNTKDSESCGGVVQDSTRHCRRWERKQAQLTEVPTLLLLLYAEGVDYVASNGSITILAGQSVGCSLVRITLIDDEIFEDMEIFSYTILPSSPRVSTTRSSADVIVTDEDGKAR